MRMVTGALLIVGSEMAFSHALLIRFPHDTIARQVLLPASLVLLVCGVLVLSWGLITERPKS